MTNEQIIFEQSLKLMQAGVIGSTGNTLEYKDESGETYEIDEPEPIHTYAGWKERGFQVKKGSKAIAFFPVWTYRPGRKRTDKDTGKEIEDSDKMFLKTAFFFTSKQCEPMN